MPHLYRAYDLYQHHNTFATFEKNKLMRILLFIFLCTIGLTAVSQENSYMQNGYIGYSYKTPNFRKDMKALDQWQGFEASFKGFAFSMHTGSLRNENVDSTYGSPSGKIFNVGYRVGYGLNAGGSSFFSAGIRPFVQMGGSLATVPNKMTSNSPASIGLVFSPGIEFRLSHVYLVVKYDAGLYLGTTPWAGNNQHNAVKGYLGGLSFTVGAENAFDLLAPTLFTFSGLRKTKKTFSNVKEGIETINGEQYRVRTTTETTVTSYTPGELVFGGMAPFWGVGPSYSFHALQKRQAPTEMRGINAGARFSYFMIDGFYEQGKIGLKDRVGREDVLLTFPQLRNYDFSGQKEVIHYGGRIGFNLSKMLKLESFDMSDSDGKMSEWLVPFSRFSVFYTMGVTKFGEGLDYTFENAESMLTDYQNFNSIAADASNNPSYLPKESIFMGGGISLELGAAFLNYTWYTYKNASIANHGQITVGANIPVGRVLNRMRTNLIYQRTRHQAKK
ncbi:MAG: hypothetical protein ACI8ZM_000008 [Crocinitomix sp.]|jgi:hypothetical protein